LLSTGKDGYIPEREFDERTERALRARGKDDRLFFRDAIEVESFLPEFLLVASFLAERRGYRLLDLGCGYGKLAPLLSVFDCAEYLGVDRVKARIEYARERYGGGVCRFQVADALSFRPGPRFDVVWTSNVMQHLLWEDKLSFIETAKAARAPGGVVILREAEILDTPREDLDRRYASADHARHMLPISFAALRSGFLPLKLRHLASIVYVAEESGE
jgi:SAM-dependent methyltransferase